MEDLYASACSVCVGSLGSVSIVGASGEVDMATVSLLAKALDDAVRSGHGNVIIDAQDLMYIDSAGLQTMISTQMRLKKEGRKMAIVGCHGIFYKLMQITKLEKSFRLYPNVDEAIEALETD